MGYRGVHRGRRSVLLFFGANQEKLSRDSILESAPEMLLQRMMSVQTSSPEAPTVLIADDESIVLRAISMTLINVGYHVLQGRDGNEARALLEEHRGQPLHLLITDLDMPGGGGQELAKFAMERYADLKVLYTSGRPPRALSAPLERGANSQFLEKPFATQELIKSIRALLTN